MSPRANFLILLAAIAVFITSMSVFVVDEREHAIKFRFGEIVGENFDPGLHFKVPFVNTVLKFEDRVMIFDRPEERFLTGEKKNLIVDYFVTWQITDPGQYYRSVQADEVRALERLSAIIGEGIKAAISRRTVQEVVSAERSELMDQMLIDARARSPELGIAVIDVRVKRIDLSSEVSDSVYNRMMEERSRVAAQLRAEGREEAERLSADADRQRAVIESGAYRDAEIIRGEADAEAASIYASAYTQDPEFYGFYRSMSAYRQAIGGAQDVLVLQPDSEFFRYLQNQSGSSPLGSSQ